MTANKISKKDLMYPDKEQDSFKRRNLQFYFRCDCNSKRRAKSKDFRRFNKIRTAKVQYTPEKEIRKSSKNPFWSPNFHKKQPQASGY